MGGFQLAYPSHSVNTAVWTPTKQALVGGTQQQRASGYQAQVTSSQRREFVYRYSAKFRLYTFAFEGLVVADQSNFETFSDAALGSSFEAIDDKDGCGTLLAWTKVKFDVGGYARTWRAAAGGTWGVTLALREVD